MNIRFLLYGIFIALLWKTETVLSVILTTTLMTGFMGGFLIGKMTLGTFLGLLAANNGTLPRPQLPQVPSVNFSSLLPSLPALIPREANQENVKASVVSDTIPSTSHPVIPTAAPVSYAAMPSMPYMYTYNYPVAYPYPVQTYVTATTNKPNTASSSQFSLMPIKPVDVPISLDNKVRDRFIRQLAIMDPLNCLPKIFCEVSADPYGATYLINHGTITNVGPMEQTSLNQEEVAAYEYHLLMQKTTTTTPQPTTTTTAPKTQNEQADDSQKDSSEEEDDISASGEDTSDEDDDSFEQYKKEHEHKIEMQALDEMVDEIDDPETYMYILRDKKRRKEARNKYKEKQRIKAASPNQGSSFRGEGFSEESENPLLQFPATYHDDYNDEASYINRRMSTDFPRRPPPMAPPTFFPMGHPSLRQPTEAPLYDMFADDPFFDDFPGSSRSGRAATRSFKSDQGKRTKRQNFQNEDLMKKYRKAYMVAEKYHSPNMCGAAFPTCPYRAKTILSVVNRLESGLLPFKLSSDKKNYFNNDNNIVHFKNTLQAIERLNQATLDAQARGEAINIDQVEEMASSPLSKFEASTSQNIVDEFQQVVAKIKSAKLKKRRKHKRRKNVKNQTKYDAVHYYKKAQMETLKPKDRLKTGVLQTKVPIRQQDDELQMRKNLGEVPSFKQTYKAMFKASKLKRERPKSNNNRRKSSTSNSKSSSAQSNEKTKPVIKKFSDVTEDDEKDAKESEEAIDALIVQGR